MHKGGGDVVRVRRSRPYGTERREKNPPGGLWCACTSMRTVRAYGVGEERFRDVVEGVQEL